MSNSGSIGPPSASPMPAVVVKICDAVPSAVTPSTVSPVPSA